jgi:SAM-dependent methyltransferase
MVSYRAVSEDAVNDQDRGGSCQICGGRELETLHRQEFILPGDQPAHYIVTACATCGFVFARDLPAAEEYESYYRSNRKYTYEGSRDTSEALFAMYGRSFDLVAAHAGREHRVLDIGCSTGELLALFQRGGYANVHGVDPSPECRDIAKLLYGLDVRTAVLSELVPDETYDVVLFANVLEHIPNLREATRHIASFVSDGGLLFVQVPDASHFGVAMQEPFFELSIEHINYFTETSLANLMSTVGMSCVELIHDRLPYKGIHYAVLTSLWRKDAAAKSMERAPRDADSVRAYIAKSERRLAELRKRIDAIVDSGEPVVIWGVGSLTARLLATTRLSEANITGFVDSNAGHHGKRLSGREIAPPSSLTGRNETVFVSSFAYGAEIKQTLERELHYDGPIVTI